MPIGAVDWGKKDIIKKFKEKLKGDGVVGIFSKTCDPGFIEVLGYAGADYVIIDLEHGSNSVQSVQNLIRGAQTAGIMPIVRVKESCASVMGEVLDIGAGGIQVYEFVREIVTKYKDDERIIIWDVFNEPGNSNRKSMSLPHMMKFFEIIRNIDPIQPLTVGITESFIAFI